MAISQIELKLRAIHGSNGSFSSTFEDTSRPGFDGHRFKFMGKRGQRLTVEGRQFYESKQEAENDKKTFEALQGKEVRLIDLSVDGRDRQVFLLNVDAGEPKKVGTSITDKDWMLLVKIDCVRTLA